MAYNGISFSNAEVHEKAKRTLPNKVSILGVDIVRECLCEMWKDTKVRKFVLAPYVYNLCFDNLVHYLNNASRIFREDYVPTQQDILLARVKTTGVNETWIRLREVWLRIVDVGGQRSERLKWVKCFTDTNSILYCVSLDGYALPSEDDCAVNSMHESLNVFANVINNQFLLKAPLIIFFNKIDLFQRLVRWIPLTICFPEYEGDVSFNKTTDYIVNRFTRRITRASRRPVYKHFTCCVDTAMISDVFKSVFDNILSKRVEAFNTNLN
uniref:guanine nucleotide-binding protein alpha-4 subunit-like isoform X2 n=1 Tax=Ciona intestinalis TaxID=7719 RepID=UPI000EF55987|nr:guanine nucleotide-binding protein alpha-4 subunit-like isoform X2 [Ciona intestinalis]|eukprot:XP_018668292.2 guanine nucleotide-binding protein alpha-4 subunit-like isoform X2 [Ciona intestinalis]